ncbi:hypothetical protein HDU87_006946 [Geranomyces variabilis]|uniref:Urease accessory protein UreF n=1 Tax=Geranomyces variabilis TaxID=109894 RepID=A0AAD5TES5_9FUNG|nr:hypothetical protein HDU87_006946 [Geranomyces variabilis]
MLHHPASFREDFLLQVLSDSNLPTGGFVSSAGLEAAVQAKHVDQTSLLPYVRASLHSYAHASLPFVRDVWACLDGLDTAEAGHEGSVDQNCDSLIGTNHIARRASRAQGAAYLTLAIRGFPGERGINVVKLFKTEVRSNRSPGHLVPCFALVCWCLGLSLQRTEHLLLFLHVRSLLSAAIRLNLVGPYQGQQFLIALQQPVEDALAIVERRTQRGGDACQTSPVADILQGLHGQLYSRMFNS